jgi:hypothetical protein
MGHTYRKEPTRREDERESSKFSKKKIKNKKENRLYSL